MLNSDLVTGGGAFEFKIRIAGGLFAAALIAVGVLVGVVASPDVVERTTPTVDIGSATTVLDAVLALGLAVAVLHVLGFAAAVFPFAVGLTAVIMPFASAFIGDFSLAIASAAAGLPCALLTTLDVDALELGAPVVVWKRLKARNTSCKVVRAEINSTPAKANMTAAWSAWRA